MDIALDAPDIGQDAVRRDNSGKRPQIFDIPQHGRAQKNKIRRRERGEAFFHAVKDAVPQRGGKARRYGVPVMVVGKQGERGRSRPQDSGDRAADQPKADKADGSDFFHQRFPFRPFKNAFRQAECTV